MCVLVEGLELFACTFNRNLHCGPNSGSKEFRKDLSAVIELMSVAVRNMTVHTVLVRLL